MKLVNRGECLEAKGKNAVLQSEGVEFVLELNWYEKDSPFNTRYVAGEGLDHLAFKVEDLDKAMEEATKAGSKVLLQMKSSGGRWAYIEDPDGLWIEIF